MNTSFIKELIYVAIYIVVNHGNRVKPFFTCFIVWLTIFWAIGNTNSFGHRGQVNMKIEKIYPSLWSMYFLGSIRL